MVLVEVTGVPAHGIVDTGADITIMGPELFKRVATVAKLKKQQFKEADKVPYTYNQHPFKLDGRLDLDINIPPKSTELGYQKNQELSSSSRSVRITLVNSVRLPPCKEVVPVKVNPCELKVLLLLESANKFAEKHDSRLQVGESLVFCGS